MSTDEPTEDDDEITAETVPAGEAEARVYTEADVKVLLENAAADAKDRHLRLAAEYENFRRRVQREKEQWTGEAIEKFVTDLLPVLDDFDRALAAGCVDDSVLQGIRLTEKNLRAALAKHGVECVDPLGAPFDPKLHEAIQRAPAGEKPAGTVVAVFEKGYVLKGKLLRAARVQVAG